MAQLLRRNCSGGAHLSLPRFPRSHASQFAADGANTSSSTEAGLPPLPKGWADNLYNRVAVVGDPRRSVIPVLERWVEEGRPLMKCYLQGMVKRMRAFRRFGHALEISVWMSDRRFFQLTPGDIADRLDLIKKHYGLAHAESYFNNIPKQLKVYQVYGTLLNCYVEDKCVEKAEALFQTMEEAKMLRTFGYNMLMKMYSDTGRPAKVEAIFDQMKTKGFVPDYFSYVSVMEAYAASANVEGMKQVMESMKNSHIGATWYIYAVAAKGHAKARLVDEAWELLNKSKELIPVKNGHNAYRYLITLYAKLGKKDEVYQLWSMQKSSRKAVNLSCLCMMNALVKLDDIEGAEAVFKEWESRASVYDFRLPNQLLTEYCRRGLVEKAELLLVDKAADPSGKMPSADTWDRLAGMYFGCGQGMKAVEMMKKALVKGKTPWRPNPINVCKTLDHLKEQKDVEGAEEIAKLLRHQGFWTREVYKCLMDINVLAGRPSSGWLDQMGKDGFDSDEES